MSFEPTDPPIEINKWKPNQELQRLALKRCSWINCKEINQLEPNELWLTTIIISAYYQGLIDGVKHLVKRQKQKAQQEQEAYKLDQLKALAFDQLTLLPNLSIQCPPIGLAFTSFHGWTSKDLLKALLSEDKAELIDKIFQSQEEV